MVRRMLLGFADEMIYATCVSSHSAKRQLPPAVASLLPLRLCQLAAFAHLSEIPDGTLPYRHQLPGRDGQNGCYAILIDMKYRIVFRPVGDFKSLPNGSPDLHTVTCIEIVAVGKVL
jgi:hypothetical protein